MNSEARSPSGRDLGGLMGTSGGRTINDDAQVDELDSALQARQI